MRFRIPFLTLTVLMVIALLSACRSGAVTPTAPLTNAQTVTPTTAPETPRPDQDRFAATLTVPSPASMTSGDGFLWVISGNSILRIDPQTNQVVGDALQPGISMEDLTFGDGSLWVTTVTSGDLGAPSDTDAVSRIDAKTGKVVSTVKVPRAPVSLAFTPEAIWVVNFGMDGDSVMRIDPKTGQISGDPIQTGRAPISLAVGDGSLWVANHDAHTVTRIDFSTGQVLANITVPSEPHRLAFGEGAVWVADWHTNSVTRIDPKNNQVVGEPIPIGFHAGNIAAGLGSVWVTSDYRAPVDAAPEDVVLVRVDPQTNQVAETIPLGGHPIDVEIAGDAVWVSVQGDDKIVRTNP